MLLQGLRVVEMGAGRRSGGRGLLADWGADVVKISCRARVRCAVLPLASRGVELPSSSGFDLDSRGKRCCGGSRRAGGAAARALARADVFIATIG
jgi:crotonobetainyl-CoA:carnitine CoA-transferase CaiB-like acyl-CoA transferase